ncbi:MAG: DNA methyltransferase [Candidatus Nitrosocaldaceae archaeon]
MLYTTFIKEYKHLYQTLMTKYNILHLKAIMMNILLYYFLKSKFNTNCFHYSDVIQFLEKLLPPDLRCYIFNVNLDDNIFNQICMCLNNYNFTLTESLKQCEEFIDPSIFSQLHEYFKEDYEKTINGAYYTQLEEQIFMCQRALVYYLNKQDKIEKLDNKYIFYNEFNNLTDNELIKKLSDIVILDPAVGTGNLMIIMLNVILSLLSKFCLNNQFDYTKIIHTLVYNIYGFDIDDYAIFITKLRLFLFLLNNSCFNYQIPFNIYKINDSLLRKDKDLIQQYLRKKSRYNFNESSLYTT